MLGADGEKPRDRVRTGKTKTARAMPRHRTSEGGGSVPFGPKGGMMEKEGMKTKKPCRSRVFQDK